MIWTDTNNPASVQDDCVLGTATAIGLGLAGLGAKAATDIVGAKMTSSAAKKAAQTQQQATDKALAANESMWRETQAMHAPYLSYGNTAMNTLGRLMSPPAGAKYAAAPMQPAPMQPPRATAPATSRMSPMGNVMYGNLR